MRFAFHREVDNPEPSTRSHPVPPGDVDGRVHVGMLGETAGRAPELGLALAVVPIHLPTRRTCLTRVRGGNQLEPVPDLVSRTAFQQTALGTRGLKDTVDAAFREAIRRALRDRLGKRIASGAGIDRSPALLDESRPVR